MMTLADKAILSSADNRPHMLEKDMYDSWKSRMELYMLNRQHGRMILESVENGPLIWPTIEENGVTRPKKYSELSAMEAIQADCDIKATNIILQGLPPEVFALVSNHKVTKELWERIQLLMQGTSFTKQERECKLYDEFDRFAYKKGETLRDFYLRFSLLLNDMNIYNMKLEQFQVNTKFLNTLPTEWSKFVTDVKLCTKPKRKQDDSWFKDKALLVQAQASGQILHDEELAFLADPRVVEAQATQTVITHNAVNHSGTEITSDSNIIPYSHVNDTLIAELERYKEQVKVLKEGQNVDLRSNDNLQDTMQVCSVRLIVLNQNSFWKI
ncbi:hypothetical protein Tco_0717089 [Tanacetum coccineum]